MPTIFEGVPFFLTLDAGETLTVTTDPNSSGLVRRIPLPGFMITGGQVTNFPASSTRMFGPFPTVRVYSFEVSQGFFTYTVSKEDFGFATDMGNVEAFTGNRLLNMNDNGKLLRCEDTSAVTITVPGNLPKGFNCSFAQWNTGSVTIAGGTGATARSTATQATGQYKIGCVLVVKNVDGKSAEYTCNGEVS